MSRWIEGPTPSHRKGAEDAEEVQEKRNAVDTEVILDGDCME